MDEEGAVKAPMTRLRRRISVEADDISSPVTTPTKKRGGRLAAKPQLELIDENTTESTPKRQARKPKAKEIVETVVAEEKLVTPSRRSARIRSNTSLVLETTQTTDSPRAKRAARRTSQVGSDNETPLTPARQTRRTRKESSSSIDKTVETNVNKTPNTNEVTEIIVEENEANDGLIENNNSLTRKSPRVNKRSSKSSEITQESDNSNDVKSEDFDISNNLDVKNKVTNVTESKQKNTTVTEQDHNDTINNSTSSLIMNMDTKSRITRDLNKTTSVLELKNEFKSKRHRTKSWSTSFIPQTSDENFFSDNEIVKKKKKNRSFPDHSQEDNVISDFNSEQKNISLNNSVSKKHNLSQIDKLITDTNKPNILSSPKSNAQINNTEKVSDLFQKSPDEMHTQIFVDSDTDSIVKTKQNKLDIDDHDQCVPVINHELENMGIENLKTNCSFEPMDIDETMPQNVSFQNFNTSSSKKSKRKPSLNVTSDKIQVTDSRCKSESQILDKISNEDKSTLILSQLKEASTNENIKHISKKENSQLFSKSINSSEVCKDTETEKNIISTTYMTSTPVHQKSSKKLGMQIDTSMISPKCNNKENLNVTETTSRESNDKKNSSQPLTKISKNDSISSNESEPDNESSKPNDFFDNGAEEANESYESGDSQDDDEKQYEKENEIIEKGETLESENEISDDTDYEKDSFVVSSDEEDEELLSGSGDDLSMSDNELRMTAKSKQKYNERKLKEQKKASKEMYEARHGINNSDQTSNTSTTKKSKRQRLDSSMLNSENDDSSSFEKQEKGTNKPRINSSQDESLNNSAIISKKKKKSKRLSESVCEDDTRKKYNITNENQDGLYNEEKEITIENDRKDEEDPLLTQIKQEPKTPQKLNMTVVKISDNIEEVQVDENITLLKANESSDPLQNNETDDDSDSSTNEKIMNDYDSILTDLNKKTKKIKSVNISLCEQKKKKKVQEAIIDELNLTKPKNKHHQNISEDNKIEKSLKIIENQQDDDAASDSIDMKLLFPEDSNDSVPNEDNTIKNRKPESPAPDYIPLKKTEAKMDISINNRSMSKIDNKNNSLNSSKKSCKMSQSNIEDSDTSENVHPFKFFIDKVGNESNYHSNSPENSTKKQNKKSISDESIISIEGIFSSGKKINKNTSLNYSHENEDVEDQSVTEISSVTPICVPNNEQKYKKGKNWLDCTQNISVEEITIMENCSATPKNKKGKKSITDVENTPNKYAESDSTNVSQNSLLSISSSKKKKSKNLNNSQNKCTQENIEFEELSPEPQSDKKVKKKDKKKLQNTEDVSENVVSSFSELKSSEKKKKDKKPNDSVTSAKTKLTLSGTIDEKVPKVEIKFKDKKKTGRNVSDTQIEQGNSDDEAPLEISFKSSKKMVDDLSQCLEVDDNINQGNKPGKKSKKRKRKSSQTVQDTIHESAKDDVGENEEQKSELLHQQKKRKVVHETVHNVTENKGESNKKKNKKRKEREEDTASSTAKIFKGNSLDHVSVSRLPSHVLSQLDDKPKKIVLNQINTPQVVSTTNFIVEERKIRKSKPSNYLEDSIYLNDTHEKKKSKGKLKKPKVLPFIPTASTSDTGFTTNFKINVLPKDIKFVAQVNNVTNFKDKILEKHKLKKFHTFETYKRQRNRKVANYF